MRCRLLHQTFGPAVVENKLVAITWFAAPEAARNYICFSHIYARLLRLQKLKHRAVQHACTPCSERDMQEVGGVRVEC